MYVSRKKVRKWVKNRFFDDLWELCNYNETKQERLDRVDCEIDDIVDSFFEFMNKEKRGRAK